MRLACLILAHDAPNHLNRMLRALEHDDIDIYVHLDRKSALDIGSFAHHGRVQFIRNRVNVWWGEFSIVEATLNLLKSALSSRGYDYLILLSGSDYPLVSTARLIDFFQINRGSEFINLSHMPNPALGKRLERLTTYKLNHGFMGGAFDRLLPKINRRLLSAFKRDYRTRLGGLQPFVGSQWWALSGGVCRHLLDFVGKHRDVVRFFQHSSIPDEMFFQTIVGNSAAAGKVRRNISYTDWTRFGPPFPAWMNQWHVGQFLENRPFVVHDAYGTGEVLFARKFSDGGGNLIDQIDASLRRDR